MSALPSPAAFAPALALQPVVRFEVATAWLVAVALALLVGVVVLIRADRSRGLGGWRGWAWLGAAVCLWALFAEPSVRGSLAAARAVLWTEGAGEDQATAHSEGVDERLLFAAIEDAPAPSSGFRAIPDAAWIGRRHPEVGELLVLGHGLERWDLDRLSARVLPVTALGKAGRERLEVTWRRRIVLGERLAVRATLEGFGAGESLALVGPSGVESAVSGAEGAPLGVLLTARPKTTGRLLYRLELTDSDGEVRWSEPIGVSVRPPPSRSVLWLQGSPSFETRHVKDWLARAGGELVVRTRVSRDRYRTEYLNAEGKRFRGLRRESLAGFDLVIVDRRSLLEAGAAGRSELLEAVAADGVGMLLILPEETTRRLGAPFNSIAVERVGDAEVLEVRPRWAGVSLRDELSIGPRALRLEGLARPIVEDASGRVLAAALPHGRGRLGVSLFADTFRWPLQGKAEAFSSLWSRLVEQLARDRGEVRWRLPDRPILVDRPLEVEFGLSGAPGEIPTVWLEDSVERVQVAVLQDSVEADRWSVRVWPLRAGWHRMVVDGDRGEAGEVWFHVAAGSRWGWWVNGERQRATLAAALRPVPGPGATERSWRKLSPVPFFALLVALWGLLWLDERRARAGAPRGG